MDTLEDPGAPDPARALDVGDMKDRIADAIARLPEREKLVIALYYYENLTLREIGEVLGVTESRISQLHTKAVLRLRSRMQERLLRLIAPSAARDTPGAWASGAVCWSDPREGDREMHTAADRIRNVALVGHRGAGKTSLHEALLFEAGVTTRLGSVTDGNTVSDTDPDEQARQMSISTALSSFEWQRAQDQPARHPRRAELRRGRAGRACACASRRCSWSTR